MVCKNYATLGIFTCLSSILYENQTYWSFGYMYSKRCFFYCCFDHIYSCGERKLISIYTDHTNHLTSSFCMRSWMISSHTHTHKWWKRKFHPSSIIIKLHTDRIEGNSLAVFKMLRYTLLYSSHPEWRATSFTASSFSWISQLSGKRLAVLTPPWKSNKKIDPTAFYYLLHLLL